MSELLSKDFVKRNKDFFIYPDREGIDWFSTLNISVLRKIVQNKVNGFTIYHEVGMAHNYENYMIDSDACHGLLNVPHQRIKFLNKGFAVALNKTAIHINKNSMAYERDPEAENLRIETELYHWHRTLKPHFNKYIHIGGWSNGGESRYEVNLSVVLNYRSKAIELARLNNQLYIFDLDLKTDILVDYRPEKETLFSTEFWKRN